MQRNTHDAGWVIVVIFGVPLVMGEINKDMTVPVLVVILGIGLAVGIVDWYRQQSPGVRRVAWFGIAAGLGVLAYAAVPLLLDMGRYDTARFEAGTLLLGGTWLAYFLLTWALQRKSP